MTPKKTPYGTWRVRWYDIDGIQRGRTFKTYKLAEQHENEARADTGRGLPTARPRTTRGTTRAAAQAWLEGAHNIDDSTRRIYTEALTPILEALGDVPIERLDPPRINAYLNSRRGKVAPSSLHREYRTIRRLLRVSGRPDVITRDTVPAPRVPHEEMRFLTAHQLEDLAATIDPRYRTLILVAGYGGLRWGELAGLRGREVDVLGHRVRVAGQLSTDGRTWKPETKTRRRRWVSLPASVVAELDVRDGYMWTLPGGGPLEHSKFRQRFFVPAAVRSSLATWTSNRADRSTHYEGLRFHDLRHTAVSLAIAQGGKPKEIQAMVGHSSIAMTYDEYGHMFPDDQSDLAARLDQLRSTTRRPRAV